MCVCMYVCVGCARDACHVFVYALQWHDSKSSEKIGQKDKRIAKLTWSTCPHLDERINIYGLYKRNTNENLYFLSVSCMLSILYDVSFHFFLTFSEYCVCAPSLSVQFNLIRWSIAFLCSFPSYIRIFELQSYFSFSPMSPHPSKREPKIKLKEISV